MSEKGRVMKLEEISDEQVAKFLISCICWVVAIPLVGMVVTLACLAIVRYVHY